MPATRPASHVATTNASGNGTGGGSSEFLDFITDVDEFVVVTVDGELIEAIGPTPAPAVNKMHAADLTLGVVNNNLTPELLLHVPETNNLYLTTTTERALTLATDKQEPALTYDVGGNVIRIDYNDGSYKVFTYTSGNLTQIDHTTILGTFRKTLVYVSGVFDHIDEAWL